MRTFCLLVCVAIGGCAANYVRITEYDGAALPVPGINAAAGGCMVSSKGTLPPGELVYEGEKCRYTTKPAE